MRRVCTLIAAITTLFHALATDVPCDSQIAKYDDISPGVPIIPSLQRINEYQGLNYSGFAPYRSPLASAVGTLLNSLPDGLSTSLTGLLTGPTPESGDTVASIGLISSLLGTGQTTGYPSATIRTADGISSFDPDTFYLGCIQNAVATGLGAVACQISISGVDAHGSDVGSQIFTYGAGSRLAAQQFQGRFKNMREITISVVGGGVVPATTVAVIDNFKYCIRKGVV